MVNYIQLNIRKKCWTFLIFNIILSLNSIYGQNFNTGYIDGFKEGFCMNKQNNTGTYLECVPPYVTPPYLRKDSINNYIEGFNKGLIDGVLLKEQNSKSSNIYSGYYVLEYKPFIPDFNFYKNLIWQKTQNKNRAQNNKIENTGLNNYYSPNNYYTTDSIETRKMYSEFLENMYLKLIKFPNNIPNGIFEVTCLMYKNSSQENLYSVHENARVLVQDNKVISVDFIYNNEKITWFAKEYFPKLNLEKNESVEELGINNSTNNIINSKAEFCLDFKINNTLFKEMYTIFFIDIIRDYNNCLEKLEKLKQDRAKKNLNKKVLDGWQDAILTNNIDFFDVRKVYVQNNKIIKWISGQGDEIVVNGGGEINYLNTTAIVIRPRITDDVFYENTFLYKEKKDVFDVYFE